MVNQDNSPVNPPVALKTVKNRKHVGKKIIQTLKNDISSNILMFIYT